MDPVFNMRATAGSLLSCMGCGRGWDHECSRKNDVSLVFPNGRVAQACTIAEVFVYRLLHRVSNLLIARHARMLSAWHCVNSHMQSRLKQASAGEPFPSVEISSVHSLGATCADDSDAHSM